MKSTSRFKTFAETGFAGCKIHGIHSEWSKQHGSQTRNGKRYVWDGLECKICGRERQASWYLNHPGYQDVYRGTKKGIITRALAYARRRSKDKSIPFEIDKNWIIKKLKLQNEKCLYSGLKFEWSKVTGSPRYRMLSIDQRVAGNGYTRKNAVLVCWGINLMKHEIPLKEFKKFCKAVSRMS